jgi:hypothetical protein
MSAINMLKVEEEINNCFELFNKFAEKAIRGNGQESE